MVGMGQHEEGVLGLFLSLPCCVTLGRCFTSFYLHFLFCKTDMTTLSVLALSSSEETVEKWEDLMVLTMIIQQTNIWPSPHFLLPPSPHTPWLTVLSLGSLFLGHFPEAS